MNDYIHAYIEPLYGKERRKRHKTSINQSSTCRSSGRYIHIYCFTNHVVIVPAAVCFFLNHPTEDTKQNKKTWGKQEPKLRTAAYIYIYTR